MAGVYQKLPPVAASVLSSSGGIVALSGALDIAGTGQYLIRSTQQHLILSASVGSQVTVSGALLVSQSFNIGDLTSGGVRFRNNSAGGLEIDNGDSSNFAPVTHGQLTVGSTAGTIFLGTRAQMNAPSADAFQFLNFAGTALGSASFGIGNAQQLRMSGTYTSASLVTAVVPKGTIAYVSDLGFPAIYNGASWNRISTGSF